MNFQKLKNNQNSKETIKLTQIHGTWYVYSIKNKKKSKKSPPSWGEGALVRQPHSVHENGMAGLLLLLSLCFTSLERPILLPSTFYMRTKCLVASVHKWGRASAVFMHGMRFEL